MLAREELRELLLLLAEPLRQLLDQRGAFRERLVAPGGKRGARGGDGALEMRARRRGAAREYLAESGVDHIEVLVALLELAVDQEPEVGS